MVHQKRIDMLAAKLAVRLPFIATLFSGMKRSIEPVGTACVKGMHVKFDPDFMDRRGDEELLFVCAHEALHTAFLHSYRVGGRDPGVWNKAADAVINRELVSTGMAMPKYTQADIDADPMSAALMGVKVGDKLGVLEPWVTADMETETVYQKMMEEQEKDKKKQDGKGQPGPGKPDPKGGWGESGDLEADDGAEGTEDSEAEVKVMVAQAARTAFASGDKSEMIQRILGAVKQSDIDWKEETRSMLSDSSRDDYSYRRFSRRFLWQDTYLPSMYSEELGVLGVGIDTSGSMTENQLAQIQAELRMIIEDCAPSKTIVVYCDSRINRTDVFMKGEELSLQMCGGGGTDMRKITNYFEGVEDRLAGVIIFSDLETPFPTIEPPYQLLWGAVGASRNARAPVGRTVEVRV